MRLLAGVAIAPQFWAVRRSSAIASEPQTPVPGALLDRIECPQKCPPPEVKEPQSFRRGSSKHWSLEGLLAFAAAFRAAGAPARSGAGRCPTRRRGRLLGSRGRGGHRLRRRRLPLLRRALCLLRRSLLGGFLLGRLLRSLLGGLLCTLLLFFRYDLLGFFRFLGLLSFLRLLRHRDHPPVAADHDYRTWRIAVVCCPISSVSVQCWPRTSRRPIEKLNSM